ncbi:protein regulator of cytokinesis 1 isoform X2 [Microcaecilia unicolor]|uniref:Protein regulator of cytokinesis 1 isoform X2 n=1 Tax=Microcaecilia unicolor TaxID=1415580 RepID=A0A6P7X5V9_9AMPH|nr:protein regulator of cytokinesis 1 isoform X2 [Microcaecilia unicolor]
MRKSEVLAAESVACLNKALSRLRDIWEEIGILEHQRMERTEVVKKHIKSLLDMMIAEEESLKERLLKNIALCRKELKTLCQELNLPSFEEKENSTILELESALRTRLKVLSKQKDERMEEVKTLKKQEQDLCDILCKKPYYIDNEAVPSLEELDQFRQHLAALTAEKDCRKAEFISTKRQIILCMEELDHLPDTSFERDVVSEDEEAICLSTENIAALKQLLHQLEEQKSKNEAICTELRSKITALWDRLQIPDEDRDAITIHMTGSKPTTIKALQTELERLDELKLQNIKQVVQKVRTELTVYWDKCFYNEEQRKNFAPFFDEEYSEDLLYQHDAELLRLKQYYEVHKELFESVQKWEESWKLYLDLERKATDPNRFTNRGGNLLKEEKQRAKLQKSLPKLEEELKAHIEAWEQEHEKEFFVNGRKLMDYVAEQWELHHQEKEKEKQERQMKKTRQTEEEMLFGSVPKTPGKRRILGPTTPSKIRKPGQIVRTPHVIKTPKKGPLERNKENMSQLNGTALSGGFLQTTPAQCNLAINSVASTYSEFARELSEASRSNTNTRILNSTTTNIPS